MEVAIDYLAWVCQNCQRIQANIVSYNGRMYATYGDAFDDVRSSLELFEVYSNSL